MFAAPKVNDNQAFNSFWGSFVSFNNHSDALVASLLLTHQLAAPVMDLFFTVLCDPTFDPSQLTIRRTQDIFESVEMDRRRKSMSPLYGAHLSLAVQNTRATPKIPQIVFEEVFALMGRRREAELHSYLDRGGLNITYNRMRHIDKDLRSMSLVRRSWTEPARRAFGRILILRNMESEHIMNNICDPTYGPWTHEIIILHYPHAYERSDAVTYTNTYSDQRWDLLQRLFYRFHNIRSICFRANPLGAGIVSFLHTLEAVPSLEQLRLMNSDASYTEASACLIPLCQALLHLPLLKYLAVHDCIPSSQINPDVGHMQDPSLKDSLSLRKVCWHLRPSSHFCQKVRCIAWTRNPGEDFKLKRLALFSIGAIDSDSFRNIAPAFETLEALFIHAGGSDETVPRLLESCTSLRTLNVVAEDVPSSHCLGFLPSTLERLVIACYGANYDLNWSDWDTRLQRSLSHCKKLRKLVLVPRMTFAPGDTPIDVNQWPQVSELCREQGTTFSFDRRDETQWLTFP